MRIREFRWDYWAAWADVQHRADRPPIIAVDTETTGLGFYDVPFAATVTWRAPDGTMKSAYFELDDDEARPVGGAGVAPAGNAVRRKHALREILSRTPTWVFHNAKFDLQKLKLIGVIDDEMIEKVELHDTQTIYGLLDENSTKKLKDLAVRVLGYEDVIAVEVKSGKNKGQIKLKPKEEYLLNKLRRSLGLKKEDGYHLLPREVLIPYALRDTEFTLQLYEALMPRLRALNDARLAAVYEKKINLKRTLLRMEEDGFKLDVPYTEEKASEYGVRVMEKWDKVVALVGDAEFNPRSPDQVKAAFARRGIELENTREDTLLGLHDDLAAALLGYRADFKIHGTYLLGLLRERRGELIHPNFNDDAARTGRLSSSSAKE